MPGRHRRPSAARTVTRTTLLLTATGAAGLGVTATSQAATVASTAPAAPAAASHAHSWRHWAHVAHRAHLARRYTAHLTAYRSSGGGGSFRACVIGRESGGSSQVMNGSGHYGLYQFSEATWVAYGGSPASFGRASVAEQNRVFDNAVASGGRSNWSAYDGC